MTIYDIISRAEALARENKLASVTPERVGNLIGDTLKYINSYQLLASSPLMHKTYASVSAMQADASPVSDLTGNVLKKGQLVVIVPADQSDATAGDVYRYDGPSGNTSAWTFIAKIGGVPADAELNATSTNPIQNQAVTAKLTELEDELEEGLKSERGARILAIDAQNKEIADFEETITNQINNYHPIEIEGNVENAPDEEDLTSVNQGGTNVLKFKNRNNLNGMGYIILRKDVSFENQLTQTNTIYEIRYDFDLGGESITIPENCILEFNGGSLSNGTIVGNNTCIDAAEYRIFYNISLIWNTSSAFKNKKGIAEWFGSIQEALDSFPNVLLTKRVYDVSDTISLNAYNTIDGNGAEIHFLGEKSAQEQYSIVDVYGEKPNIETICPIAYNENYAIKVGHGSYIDNLRITFENGEVNGILIDPNYLKYTREHSKFHDNVDTGSSTNNILNRITLVSATFAKGGSGCAIALLTTENYGVSSGLWGHIAHDIRIFGDWFYGIAVDNGVLINNAPEFWITLSHFNDIEINTAKVGIYINKQSGTIYRPGGLSFSRIKYQYVPVAGSGRTHSLRVGVLGDCNGINFDTCSAIGWDDGSIFSFRPFLIRPSKANDIVIKNSITALHRSTRIIDYLDYPYVRTDIKVIETVHNSTFNLLDFIPSDININAEDTTLAPDRHEVVRWLRIIPDGYYVVDSSLSTALDLPTWVRIERYCIMKVVSAINRKYFVLYNDTIGNNRGDSLIIKLTIAYTQSTLYNSSWVGTQNMIYRKNPSDSVNNSKDLFISNAKKNLTYVDDESTTIYRGYTVNGQQRFSEINFSGNRTERPILINISTVKGFCYFDTDLGIPIYWNGISWIEYDGAVAGVKRSGTWANRPITATDIYNGFMYMINDGANHFPIYAHINGNTVEWYKADGTQYTGA